MGSQTGEEDSNAFAQIFKNDEIFWKKCRHKTESICLVMRFSSPLMSLHKVGLESRKQQRKAT